jgi:glycosyltransferase involved in cell wall biosynthesis
LRFVFNGIKASRSNEVDLVVASNLKTALAATVARIFGGAPWIWYIHDYLDRGGLLKTIAAKFLLASCSGWIAVSRDVAVVTRSMAWRPKKGSVVYNHVRRGTQPQILNFPRMKMDEAVLFVGSINAWKGLRCLVEGMGAVKSACGTAPRIDVVGEIVDKEYWEGVQALVLQHGLELRYLGLRTDVPTLMQQYSVLIHPTPAAEPFGLVVAEAILAGCFVISTAQGGVREILSPEMLECSFDPRNPATLAKAMRAAVAAQVLYRPHRDSVVEALTAMTSEEAYSRSLRLFFQSVAPIRAAA